MRKLILILMASLAMTGCCSLPPLAERNAEDFRRQLIKYPIQPGDAETPTVQEPGACSPSEFLRLIPIGTPMDQARSIMEANGFHCLTPRSTQNTEGGVLDFRATLHEPTNCETCQATTALLTSGLVPDAWTKSVVSTDIHISVEYEARKVKNAKIWTTLTGL
jgi:hypothetical protein